MQCLNFMLLLGTTSLVSAPLALAPLAQEKTKCPYCGTVNPVKAKACSSCSGNLDFVTFPTGTRLTKSDGADIQPCWTHEGKIAYSSQQRGDFIFVMGADGSNPTKVPSTETMGDYQPHFSKDGKIVFVGRMVSNDIFTMDADGSNRKRLTDFSSDDIHPSWNEEGKIVFSSDRGGLQGYNIYIMDADGENVLQLTKEAGDNLNPCWSPDGKRIVFNSTRNDNNDVYVMDADGSNVKRLTTDPKDDYDPSWGPDGRIAFVSERGQSPDIFLMSPDGSGQKQVTNNKWDDLKPCLGSDGRLLFQSRRDAGTGIQEDIYLIKLKQ